MKTLMLADRQITTELPAFIMGIVNVTADSFYEKSRGGAERALELVEQGADIIDVGGESSRPGTVYVDETTEMARVIPVIEEIRRHSDVPISVDTRKRSVMEAAWKAGANIINDISALGDDDTMAAFAARTGIPVILMHKRGDPATMQTGDTSYTDPFAQVNSYLEDRVAYALSQGIDESKIIVDPGIGFGKNLETNRTLVANAGLLCGGKYPVLMALSRKSFLSLICDGREVADRLAGTITADIVAVLSGASLLRVHDVRDCRDSLAVLQSCMEAKKA